VIDGAGDYVFGRCTRCGGLLTFAHDCEDRDAFVEKAPRDNRIDIRSGPDDMTPRKDEP
jgi:hypothetical protein